jgi:hypothetical protein
MTNQLPPLPDDNSHFDETVQHQPPQNAPNRQPRQTQGQQPVQRPPRQATNYNVQRVSRQRQQQSKKENMLYFPLWSLGLMLLVVLVLAFVVVFLVVSLGGKSATSEADPVLRVITAVATNTPNIPDPNEAVLVTSTIPADIQVILPEHTPVNLALDGPVLPTIAFTTTPVPLTVGVRVVVANVGDQELNVRDVAGVTTSEVLFRSAEGTEFSIIDGPQQADGFTWWRIQDPISQQSGWAVANYLQVFEAGVGVGQ